MHMGKASRMQTQQSVPQCFPIQDDARKKETQQDEQKVRSKCDGDDAVIDPRATYSIAEAIEIIGLHNVDWTAVAQEVSPKATASD